jgi:hypothetical protein
LLVEVEFASPDVQEFKYWVREATVSSVFAVELGRRFKFKFGTIHFRCQFGVTAWIAEATSMIIFCNRTWGFNLFSWLPTIFETTLAKAIQDTPQ